MAHVESIHLAAAHGDEPTPVASARAVAGGGFDGDRHGDDITLIEAEALEELARDHDIEIGPGVSRRQVTTRGIDLNALIGERFRVGEVECVGVELCEPCRRLEGYTQPGVIRALVHRAGINADVVKSGEIAPGDPISRC